MYDEQRRQPIIGRTHMLFKNNFTGATQITDPTCSQPGTPHIPSNYRVCKHKANKSPLKPNTKQAPARTSKQTNKRGQATHNFSHLRPPSPSFLSLSILVLHSILILLLLCLPGYGSEAADSAEDLLRNGAGGWERNENRVW
jgi:hypothetical protein